MLTQLYPAVPKRQVAWLTVSLALHFIFLAWILHSPVPIFVAPSSVSKGQSGNSLTRIYFGGGAGVAPDKTKPKENRRAPNGTAAGEAGGG
jgi:hypothetical protein